MQYSNIKYTHTISDDNFRLTPDSNEVVVDYTSVDGEVTVDRIYMTCDLLRCIRSFTELANEIELEAQERFGRPYCEQDPYDEILRENCLGM